MRGNFWPTTRFTDLEDLNALAGAWLDGVANVRTHGTTGERPVDRLAQEHAVLRPLPPQPSLAPFLREDRKVGRDGYVQRERSYYGVTWTWAGQGVQVAADANVIKIWAGHQRLAVHPRSPQPGKRYSLPNQWEGLEIGDGRCWRSNCRCPRSSAERSAPNEALLAGGDR